MAIACVLRPVKSNVALLEGAACPPTKGLSASHTVYSHYLGAIHSLELWNDLRV